MHRVHAVKWSGVRCDDSPYRCRCGTVQQLLIAHNLNTLLPSAVHATPAIVCLSRLSALSVTTMQEGVWETMKIERYVSVVGVKQHAGNL